MLGLIQMSKLLNPDSRSIYTSILTPPDGMKVDAVIGTTFSLDLEFLLEVPVFLSLLGMGGSSLKDSPIKIMDSIRKYSEKMTIYYQEGRIQNSYGPNTLFGLLEPICYSVKVPRGGVFHPKMWIIRYKSIIEDGSDSLLRLAVLSRNMTHDRSWDILLQLEGTISIESTLLNDRLIRFLEYIQKNSSPKLVSNRKKSHDQVITDLKYTHWQLPDKYEEISFHFPGIEGLDWVPAEAKRIMIISPFCRDKAISSLIKAPTEAVALVSRENEYHKLSDTILDSFKGVYHLHPDMTLSTIGDTEEKQHDSTDLHAKVYVQECKAFERTTYTRLILGSANATNAALVSKINIEMLVEIAGNRTYVGGIDDILDDKGFKEFLVDLNRNAILEADENVLAGDKITNAVRNCLIKAITSLSFTQGDASNLWHLTLSINKELSTSEASISAWPATLPRSYSIDVQSEAGGYELTWKNVELASLTNFITFNIDIPSLKISLQFVSLIDVISEWPETRDAAILQAYLNSPEALMQYILYILTDDNNPLGQIEQTGRQFGNLFGANERRDPPMLEELVRIFNRDPAKLDEIDALILDLEKVDQGGKVLLDRFKQLWLVFRAAQVRTSNE